MGGPVTRPRKDKMKRIEQKQITSRGKTYQLWGRSETLAAAKREAAALREQGEPSAFARRAGNGGEIYVNVGR